MVLMIANQLPRLRRWMLAFGLALIVTSVISVFAPAVAAFVYLDLTPQVYANISSTVYTHVPTLEGLRAGTFRSIPLDNLEGLFTFPSFHTAGALMFIWALRTVPYVRWPAITLNVALIVATPVDGAHYISSTSWVARPWRLQRSLRAIGCAGLCGSMRQRQVPFRLRYRKRRALRSEPCTTSLLLCVGRHRFLVPDQRFFCDLGSHSVTSAL